MGIVISVASTMVLARLLMDRGELHSRHGRIMIGITLVEDLAVVILIVLIPALGTLEPGRLLTIALALGKSLLILIPAGYVAAKVIPPLMTRVARMHSDEMFLLVALAVGLGTAALTQAAGLSLALGAFLAGLIINGSDYAHETLARLLPLRDVFVALFFVTIGALIDPARPPRQRSAARHHGGDDRGAASSCCGRVVVWLFRESFWTRAAGRGGAHPDRRVLVRPGPGRAHRRPRGRRDLQRHPRRLARHHPDQRGARAHRPRLDRPATAASRSGPPRPAVERAVAEHVVLCGFGRVGSAVGEALETFGIRFVVIERDPDIVRGLRSRGVPCLFGDAAQPRLLEEAGSGRASLVVVALPEMDRAQLAVRGVRAPEPAACRSWRARTAPRAATGWPTRAPPRSFSPSWKRRPR